MSADLKTSRHPIARSQLRRRASNQQEIGLAAFRRRFGISQALAARLLDLSLRTISALESSKPAASRGARNLIQVKRLCEALSGAMRAGHVGEWLDSPNEMLIGLKPVEAIERGQIDQVWQVAEGLRTGSQL